MTDLCKHIKYFTLKEKLDLISSIRSGKRKVTTIIYRWIANIDFVCITFIIKFKYVFNFFQMLDIHPVFFNAHFVCLCQNIYSPPFF